MTASALSGDSAATLLSPERLVVLELPSRRDYETLPAEVIIGSDGSVICWASYGAGLDDAIRNL
ncbi:hypothetical protein [Actinospica robiniae]|uniref:hypothetical protein n=1 Tax=Actinospica robiniae TaxID=304901 RepID=UPI000405B6EA|nr:hypothetical protein [Actinospica robiniae]